MRESIARPPLVFVTTGVGGTIVKKLLLDCRSSTSPNRHSVWTYCTGVIFCGVPHLEKQHELRKLQKWAKPITFLGKLITTINLDIDVLITETETINQHFMSILSDVPPTFCIVQVPGKDYLKRSMPNEANATFASRQNDDSNFTIYTNSVSLTFSGRGDKLYGMIVSRLRRWRSGSLNKDIEPVLHQSEPLVNGLRLLSLDGGGVRGLCSLLVLDRLMQEIKKIELEDRPESRDWPRLPCRYFELCGGTSTGGLIAILLFRLRLDTSTAIADYKQLAPQIFKSGPLGQVGKLGRGLASKPWFKAERLEKAVKSIVQERLPFEEKSIPGSDPENARLIPPTAELQASACKMFVCAWDVDEKCTTRFRNYRSANEPEHSRGDCTIWEAARATSAAPFYFPAAHVNDSKYWDGAVVNNNPIDEVWTEKGTDRATCVVSLGTGLSERKESKGVIPVVGRLKRLAKIFTQVETNHRRYEERLRREGIPYFRFNPTTKQDDIGLDEYQKLDALERHTKEYLAMEDVAAEIRNCASVLVGRRESQNEAAETTVPDANDALTEPSNG